MFGWTQTQPSHTWLVTAKICLIKYSKAMLDSIQLSGLDKAKPSLVRHSKVMFGWTQLSETWAKLGSTHLSHAFFIIATQY